MYLNKDFFPQLLPKSSCEPKCVCDKFKVITPSDFKRQRHEKKAGRNFE